MTNISKPLLILGLAAGLLAPAAALADRPPVPRPCLAPAHPLVKKTPKIEVGGAQDYHQWHLGQELKDGFKASAPGIERPIRVLNTVVLLVDFEDQPMDSTGAYFDTILQYLKEIYDEQSDGQVVINTTRPDSVYRMPEPMAYYGLDDSIATREGQLIADAVKTADPDVDFSQFDTYITFHAGVGQEADVAGNNDDAIWSVFFRQVDLAFWGPDRNPRGVPTADTTAQGDSVFVTSMVLVPEVEAQDGYDFGIMGVVAHEFGHRFNLPDLYDTTYPAGLNYIESQGIGAFGLMGAGIWNANGWYPAEMCAWSKFFAGWIRPRVLLPEDGEQSISLEGIVHDRRFGAVRIPLGGDEYFLIENRMRDYNENGRFDFNDVDGDSVFTFGVDSYLGAELDWHLPQEPVNQKVGNLDGSGLLIWHIDESVIEENLFYNTVNAFPDHKGIDLEEADGIQDLDNINISYEGFGDAKDAYFSPNNTSFTPESVPSSHGYHGAVSEVWVTDIPEHGRVMTFNVAFGGFEDGYPEFLEGRVGDFQPITFDVDGDGLDDIVAPYQTDDTFAFRALGANVDRTFGGPMLRADPIRAQVDEDPEAELVWAGDQYLWAMNTGGDPYTLAALTADPGRFALVAADVAPEFEGQAKDELVVGAAETDQDLVAYRDSGSGYEPWLEALDWMDTSLPASAGDLRGDDLTALVVSARLPQPDGTVGGRIVVLNSSPGSFSLGDTVAFGAPVVGDLNRDGRDDVVVAADDGHIYALTMEEGDLGSSLQIMEGWPLFVEALAGDAVSLADFDNDGYLEVLAFGPVNAFYAVNYNGVIDLELPVTVPAENRFTAPFRAPLIADVHGDAGLELLLPMADGQVRGLRLDGAPIPGWAYMGKQQYPLVFDMDGDGMLELATVEDVTVEIPDHTVIERGDFEDLPRLGRVVVREVGQATGEGPWSMYRGSYTRNGYAPPPELQTTEAPPVKDLFVMPNPLREGVGGFHYRVADNVEAVEITIFDITGQEVRTLSGTIYPGVDNLVSWDLKSDRGNDVAPGLYVAKVRVESPSGNKTDMYKFSVLR